MPSGEVSPISAASDERIDEIIPQYRPSLMQVHVQTTQVPTPQSTSNTFFAYSQSSSSNFHTNQTDDCTSPATNLLIIPAQPTAVTTVGSSEGSPSTGNAAYLKHARSLQEQIKDILNSSKSRSHVRDIVYDDSSFEEIQTIDEMSMESSFGTTSRSTFENNHNHHHHTRRLSEGAQQIEDQPSTASLSSNHERNTSIVNRSLGNEVTISKTPKHHQFSTGSTPQHKKDQQQLRRAESKTNTKQQQQQSQQQLQQSQQQQPSNTLSQNKSSIQLTYEHVLDMRYNKKAQPQQTTSLKSFPTQNQPITGATTPLLAVIHDPPFSPETRDAPSEISPLKPAPQTYALRSSPRGRNGTAKALTTQLQKFSAKTTPTTITPLQTQLKLDQQPVDWQTQQQSKPLAPQPPSQSQQAEYEGLKRQISNLIQQEADNRSNNGLLSSYTAKNNPEDSSVAASSSSTSSSLKYPTSSGSESTTETKHRASSRSRDTPNQPQQIIEGKEQVSQGTKDSSSSKSTNLSISQFSTHKSLQNGRPPIIKSPPLSAAAAAIRVKPASISIEASANSSSSPQYSVISSVPNSQTVLSYPNSLLTLNTSGSTNQLNFAMYHNISHTSSSSSLRMQIESKSLKVKEQQSAAATAAASSSSSTPLHNAAYRHQTSTIYRPPIGGFITPQIIKDKHETTSSMCMSSQSGVVVCGGFKDYVMEEPTLHSILNEDLKKVNEKKSGSGGGASRQQSLTSRQNAKKNDDRHQSAGKFAQKRACSLPKPSYESLVQSALMRQQVFQHPDQRNFSGYIQITTPQSLPTAADRNASHNTQLTEQCTRRPPSSRSQKNSSEATTPTAATATPTATASDPPKNTLQRQSSERVIPSHSRQLPIHSFGKHIKTTPISNNSNSTIQSQIQQFPINNGDLKNQHEMSVVERNKEWLLLRKQKNENRRSELEKKEIESCTFHPNLRSKSPISRIYDQQRNLENSTDCNNSHHYQQQQPQQQPTPASTRNNEKQNNIRNANYFVGAIFNAPAAPANISQNSEESSYAYQHQQQLAVRKSTFAIAGLQQPQQQQKQLSQQQQQTLIASQSAIFNHQNFQYK